MSNAYLSLGSNLGNRQKNIEDAISLLNENPINIVSTSSIIETNPIGGPRNQNKYLNAVVEVTTDLSPHNLLYKVNKIEHRLGRVRTIKDGPRTIDIDILIFDSIKIESDDLTIPHPRMLDRDFVMIPLKEIAKELVENLDYANN
ncbi:MAG: 2-amino-4-hydroxy-6-hydroxymethyldihydropteridine diphosphokinase [Candidatus Zapsychrus exili]|nr:2-amino-4-hydroxy-6-hydroxymethyldihydropteridine diphosphokinase [Candidatus Zapsychrus exili]